MILATADFLTGITRTAFGNFMCGLSVKVTGRLAVFVTGLILWGFPGSAMALMVSAPMVRKADGLVCKLLHDTGSDGAGQPVAGAGVALAPSACRMLRVAVRISSGTLSGGHSDAEIGSAPRRLGNAVDAAEYKVDICENATGLMLFDEHHPFVRRMLMQVGRDSGYGQEVDYVHTRHGFTVHPIAAGEFIRLTLNPWLGRLSAKQAGQTLEAPEVEDLQMSTTVDVIPGQWTELGSYREKAAIADQASTRRVLGNSSETLRIRVRVDDIGGSDRRHK